MDIANDNDLKLFIVLNRAHRAIVDHVTEDMKRYGLNPTEFMVLEVLYHRGDLPIQQIRHKVLLASGSITYVVDKLEAKNLVKRKPCPEDGRVTFASITKEGKNLMDNIFPQHHRAIRRIFEALDEEEKSVITTLLKKVGFYAQGLS